MIAVQCCADTPGVSQIVYLFGPDGDPDDGVQYMRTEGEFSSGRDACLADQCLYCTANE